MFQVTTDALKEIHAETGPNFPSIDGAHAFDWHSFVGDRIFVEPRLGRRQAEVVD